ncbi:unnamed protein product [Caenorhabditis sp. 36 PRJEB53466]|nr:unnamed protein product [Caenorhabditis sp. 36 PRJEB53466]
MPVLTPLAVQNSTIIPARLFSGSEGQYLTVPSTFEATRANTDLQSELPCSGHKNILCVKLCACVAMVFLFCMLIVFVYSILLSKYNNEQKISNDSLLAALVEPKESTV